MGFGTSADNLPAEKPKPLGLDTSRLDTHEQGRVLPYVAGIFRIGGTFLSEPWDVRSEEIKKKVGKKKQTVGYNYYCSFAVAFCLGPIDRLDAIYLDDDLLWEGPVTRGPTSDYFDITMSGRGTLRLYWGTSTQTQDQELATTGVSHPAYRNQCYAVFMEWSLGSRTSVPNVEIQGRRKPSVPWLTTEADIGDDVNPIAVLGDLWESPRFGLGLSIDRLNQSLLGATAATLRTEGLGVSPVITSPTSFQQTLTRLFDHIDGYMTYDDQGRFGIGLVRGPAGGEPTLDATDLTEPPDIQSVSWWDTYNEVFVRFRNRDRKFADESVSWRDRGNYAVVGSTRGLSVSRPWVTRQKTAWLIAASICRQKALPYIEGTIRVKKSSADQLAAGSLFYLTYAPSNLSGVLCRVLEKTQSAPERAEVTLRWREDRGYLNANLADVSEDPSLTEETFNASAPSATRIIELPFGYVQSFDPWVLFLVARGDRITNGFNGYVEASLNSYDQVGSSGVFALRGTLQAGFPATVLREDSTAEMDVSFDSPDRTLESVAYDSALRAGPMRLFVGDEIMLGYTATLVSSGRYRIKVLRGRFGTRRRSHLIGAEVFALVIGQNPLLTHELAWNPSLATARFKVQPFLLQDELDLSACPAIALTVQRRGYCPPPPINLRVFGDGYAPTYSTGQSILVEWDTVSDLRSFTPTTQDLAPQASRTLIAVYGATGIFKGEIAVYSATGPLTIANADLVAYLGGETDFSLRAYSERGGFRSLDYDEITIRKV